METDRDRRVREKAYLLWEQRGGGADGHEEDWLAAERSVTAESGPDTQADPASEGPAPKARKAAASKAAPATGKAEKPVGKGRGKT